MTIDLDKLKTGDLLLFSAHLSFNPLNIFSLLIEFFTKRPYSHIGMILRDPTWIKPDLKGLYLWESSFEGTPDPQDGKIKLGVQITPIEKVLEMKQESIYVKQLKIGREKLTIDVLTKIHKIVYEKPYDLNPIDWLEAYLRKDFSSRKTDRFFCSAFIACIYTEAGILEPNTDWSIIRPSDFDDESGNYLTWMNNSALDKLYQIK